MYERGVNKMKNKTYVNSEITTNIKRMSNEKYCPRLDFWHLKTNVTKTVGFDLKRLLVGILAYPHCESHN